MRTLKLRLPLIEPSRHISWFASLLEFGTSTTQDAVDATRLVARMDRNWLAPVRRPSRICGAALLIAARMSNFQRSVREVVEAHGNGAKVHTGKCVVCMEGPQFSTRAESKMYRSWGADIINMSVLPEAKLAREAELGYVCPFHQLAIVH